MNQASGVDTAARRRSRRVIIQLLYQWHLTQDSVSTLVEQFLPELEAKSADKDYFDRVVVEMFPLISALDEKLSGYLSRDTNELSLGRKAVFRLGAVELDHCVDVPYQAVINEAVELNKRYGTKEGHRFENGVLDKFAQESRATEFKSK